MMVLSAIWDKVQAFLLRLIFDWTDDDLDDEYLYNYDND